MSSEQMKNEQGNEQMSTQKQTQNATAHVDSEQTKNEYSQTSHVDGEQTSEKKRKRTQKSTLVVTDEIRKKVSAALDEMSKEITKRTVEQSPAEIFIRDNIALIDKMTKDKVTLNQIFERVNKVFKLNIKPASFGIYVRKVRIEMNSELAPKRRSKKEQTQNELLANSKNENDGFVCEHCKTNAVKMKSESLGLVFWLCEHCNTCYKDNDNKLTNEIIKSIDDK